MFSMHPLFVNEHAYVRKADMTGIVCVTRNSNGDNTDARPREVTIDTLKRDLERQKLIIEQIRSAHKNIDSETTPVRFVDMLRLSYIHAYLQSQIVTASCTHAASTH